MAAKTAKTTELTPEPVTTPLTDLTALNLEDLLADEILNGIDWQAVKSLILQKAQAKFWAWISAAAPATPYALNEVEAIAIGTGESNDI